MLSRSCRSGWVSLVAVVVFTSTSIAQQNVTPTQNADLNSSQSPADDSAGLMEIVVTAQKREQRLQDIGMSIQAFSGNELADRGITSTQDLDKVVAGFTFAQTATGTPVYTLRGVGYFEESMSASPAVSVYVDEVPLPFPLMGLGADLDMQRVEVLKGPREPYSARTPLAVPSITSRISPRKPWNMAAPSATADSAPWNQTPSLADR